MACHFLRLSKVKILPKAADHVKKAVLEGVGVYQTLFQGKQRPSREAKEQYRDLTLNNPLLEEAHLI
jgi:hypothetical protein